MFAVFDTNHFCVIAEGGAQAISLAERAAGVSADIFLSIITIHEATGGWLGLINSRKAGPEQVAAYASFQKTVLAFQKFSLLPFDVDAAERFLVLRKVHPRTGTMDLKIAAICLAHDATLLTRNVVDFTCIAGLRVENWLD